MNRTILLVDDEPSILELLQFHVEREGFRVLTSQNGENALVRIQEDRPDLIVLDFMLPGVSGLDVLRHIRQAGDIPVIMLTARKEEIDRVLGLELGADDYVTKPFSMRELIARIKALLRRREALVPQPSPEIHREGLVIRPEEHTAALDGTPIHVTLTEFEILSLLMQNPGRVFSRDDLLRIIWGYDFSGDARTINVHIRNLREKLASAGSLIETVRGVGYRFRAHGNPRVEG
ncbi:MAG: response regulator transcription factor [Firmicutes bacterium]|nr:response regulator transcription factor [Bacillota bacterium]